MYPVTLRPYQKNSYFRKFLEYVAPVKKTSLFCTQSYPEDALKINVKHVGFLNQMSEMNKNDFYYYGTTSHKYIIILHWVYLSDNWVFDFVLISRIFVNNYKKRKSSIFFMNFQNGSQRAFCGIRKNNVKRNVCQKLDHGLENLKPVLVITTVKTALKLPPSSKPLNWRYAQPQIWIRR